MKAVVHPAPMNPKLIDSELVDQINVAAADVADFAAKALELMERVRPVQEAWRLFCATQDAPDEVLDALDQVSGFSRLDDLLRDLWQFLQHATEMTDTQPVIEGFRTILAGGEDRSMHQIKAGRSRGPASQAREVDAASAVRAVADAVVRREVCKRRVSGVALPAVGVDGGGPAAS